MSSASPISESAASARGHLDAASTQALKTLALEQECGLHAVMLTLMALEVRRRTGGAEFVIGSQTTGNHLPMLPVLCRVERHAPFGATLRAMQVGLATGFRDNPSPSLDFAVIESTEAFDGAATVDCDMALEYRQLADGGLRLLWNANASVYSQETARTWFAAVRDWAAWLAEDPARASEPLPPLLPREAALLEVWEYGVRVVRPPLRFHELFERTLDADVEQRARPAIVTPAGITTYQALEHQANAIAHGLLQRGIAAGDVVAVLTGRSANLPAAVLGIWKAGATYLPLAADMPEERLDFMACDAGVAHWIALDGLGVPAPLARALPAPLRPEQFHSEFRNAHAHRPPASGSAGDAAYIIYTSGSTGRPKGTLIGHDAYVNTVLGAGEALALTRHDRSLLFSSPSFDVSLSDIGLPLAFGGALCPVPEEVLHAPTRFRDFLSELGVTVADVTPSYLRLFEGAELPSVRTLVTGGETPITADVENYAARHQYFNAYGPTENTITCTMKQLRPGDGCSLAGRPLPNTSVHVCDSEGNPVPPSVVGELWLGGAGLARGYVGRPELTATAFVETARGRRYRSGDLGRWSRNGEIEILGRIDDQVKLNGIRVELGEIEHAIGSHPGVAQAVALLDGAGGQSQSLWAFVRPKPGREVPPEESWRGYLAGRLPGYMIPSRVIAVPGIPLTHSGKVDKEALRKLLAEQPTPAADGLPRPGLETEIARLWSELLGKSAGRVIQRDDNFFNLGGHSLLAIVAAHKLEKLLGHPVPPRELFAEPTLCGFAARMAQLGKTAAPARTLSDRATEGQREFWVAEQAGLDGRALNLCLTLAVAGEVPLAAEWRRAWSQLVARHDALRTGFHEDSEGVVRRTVLPRVYADFECSVQPDLSAALAHVRERQADPFELGKPPLWRAGLIAIDGREPVFWLVLHHSVSDGASLGILTGELSALLRGKSLPALTATFDESAGREESYLVGSDCREDARYWQQSLDSLANLGGDAAQPFDEWPLDSPRHMARDVSGAHSFGLRLDHTIADGLREFARRHGASLHALIVTLMAHEVRRRTGRPQFLLGTAASTRASADEAGVVGFYVNVLPVPCQAEGGESFEQLLRAMQRTLAEGLQHARYPFSRMHREFRQRHAVVPDGADALSAEPQVGTRGHDADPLSTAAGDFPFEPRFTGAGGNDPHAGNVAIVHDPARFPLIDMAVTENPATSVEETNELHFQSAAPLTGDTARYELRPNRPPQDMVLVHEGQPDGSLTLQWLVNAGLYERDTAEAWLTSLAGWARYLTESRRVPESPLPTLLPEEAEMLGRWERGPELPHPSPSLAAQFEHWAMVQPRRPALITEDGVESYAQLNARANAMAHALLGLGVGRQDRVGVLTGRSTSLPAAVLAIWKAGGCYLPMVTDLPAERLAFIARNAGIRVLVVLDGHQPPGALLDTGCVVFRPESLSAEYLAWHRERPETAMGSGAELAYIIHTSGSAGVPKGVMLHHQGLLNVGVGMNAELSVDANDRVLMMWSPAFDAWIGDLAMAWTAGAAVVPAVREEVDDIVAIREKLARLRVSVAITAPAYLRLFEQANFPGLRLLATGGEPPNLADARHYAGHLSYFNGYGPTEATVAAGFGRVLANARRATAGKPLANTSIHIRDGCGEPVPPGAVGEIWLGGMGIALGYLNRPDLTAASFVDTSAGRIYRTGDLGRWTHAGELQVLGRSDSQVKLHGHRIELGEIEHRLSGHLGVQQGVAAAETRSDGTVVLRAFVCFQPGAAEPTQAAWRRYLSAMLPSYMLPSDVLRVPAIPMSIAGKVDRAALLRMARSNPADNGRQPDSQPHEGAERRIAEVWAEQLNCESISREGHFFDLGGDSLRAIAVVNQLRRAFQCSVNDLYEHPRLADFAAACRHRPEHLRMLIQSAAAHWRGYHESLAAYEREREAALATAWCDYEARNRRVRLDDAPRRRDYRRVLLTGSTGYLGSYLLRELLSNETRQVSVLVRGSDDAAARARLGKTLCHYFGADGPALRDCARLTVLAGDLRRDDLGLSERTRHHLADSVQAVFHCAANVKHFGHYREFQADNVLATARLLQLAGSRKPNPADFHLISTLSVCGKPPEAGFRLFTEYDDAPGVADENYYIRSKQEAERLVVAARGVLANACIHRVGNLVYAAGGGPLQYNIRENAFFRQIAAFLRLGVVPDDAHLWLCHVDVVARASARLAEVSDLTNLTHHLENARMSFVADFVTAAGGVRACAFGDFLKRLEAAVDEAAMHGALSATIETFGLYRGLSPHPRARRTEIVSGRTQALLARCGVDWPGAPAAGQREMLRQALELPL